MRSKTNSSTFPGSSIILATSSMIHRPISITTSHNSIIDQPPVYFNCQECNYTYHQFKYIYRSRIPWYCPTIQLYSNRIIVHTYNQFTSPSVPITNSITPTTSSVTPTNSAWWCCCCPSPFPIPFEWVGPLHYICIYMQSNMQLQL